jgi:hypothetical protein
MQLAIFQAVIALKIEYDPEKFIGKCFPNIISPSYFLVHGDLKLAFLSSVVFRINFCLAFG